LVRGPIIDVAETLTPGRGEFTVVLYIGQSTINIDHAMPTPSEIADEFGVMTNIGAITKRKAINTLARKHGLAPNLVYDMLEAAKKSG
jgi:hypothetical protein